MIDLLPTSEKSAIRKEYRLRVLTVSLGLLSSVFAAMVISLLPTYLLTVSRYDAFLAESQSDETQSRISQVKDMELMVRDTNKKIDILKEGTAVIRVQDIVGEILESKGAGLTITSLAYDSGGVTSKRGKEDIVTPPTLVIQGSASDRAALLSFKETLSQKKEFGAVDLPISSLVKETNLSFSINISMAPAVQKTKNEQ